MATIARRMQGNEWLPQVNLYSAKVLRNDPNSFDTTSPDASFPHEERAESNSRGQLSTFTESTVVASSTIDRARRQDLHRRTSAALGRVT